ncbi:L-cystine transport system substrate-binding protein [Lysinibacillus composti]|uniref:Amino acid ABC transporter substrate-binding protein n=1 Tax=Lysinibacillus composti TaxID=720633 RepID=A0A3N9UHR6_9BACI|nr:transporter substrate-binding domain-containing protein [Lysinibacillus composti]MBM7609626.1 L-cystine transport system substrate-binding protein [Lysinibacillus composti]RQW75663.1 amino acid ABC transporter substrate-binding protein [Lysinibacillus composti]
MKKAGIALTLAASLLLTACGSTKESATSETAGSSSSSAEAEKVIIGTGSDFINICFYDEDGNLTGYDIELLKEIDNRLEEYEFDFQTMDFSNLLLSLESKKIDIIAHNMAKNPEREEKFLFNKQPYNAMPTHVVVHEGNTEVQSIDDLEGKKVGLQPTSNASLFVEKYFKEHNMNTESVYVSSTQDYLNQLKTGRIDAIFLFPFAVDIFNRESDAELKVVGEPLMFTDIHFMFNKEDQKLSDAVDGALEELIEDGTVKELSTKWLGADYSVELNK